MTLKMIFTFNKWFIFLVYKFLSLLQCYRPFSQIMVSNVNSSISTVKKNRRHFALALR